MPKKIYMDYAAATPVDPRVVKAMLPYFTQKFGNSAAIHSFGQEMKIALEKSRQTVAEVLKAKPEEIIFTGSATESNNLAIKGVALANKNRSHIIISSIEHDCVLNSAKWLAGLGQGRFEVTRVPVDKYGLVDPKDIRKAIRKNTLLVSVMHANNEIGTIEPIEKIGRVCRQKGVYFHTDAAQSFGKMPIDVNKMGIDLLTASSHKMYGPKGAALLYVRKGVKIEPILHGGGHESGLRASTVNVPAIVGFAKAVELCQKEMASEAKRQIKLRDKIIINILKNIPDSHLNGHPKKRLSNNVNVRFAYVEGESIMMQFDSMDVAVTTGSACASKSLEPSHVLLACGLRSEEAHGSIRLTIGRWTKGSEIDYVLKVLPGIMKNLRKISPFKKHKA